MPTLVLVPFAIFFLCTASQFWFLAQVRNALIDRHAKVFLEIERSSVFPHRGLYKFIRSGRHNELRDPELSAAIMRVRFVYLTAIAAWLFMVFVIVAVGQRS